MITNFVYRVQTV